MNSIKEAFLNWYAFILFNQDLDKWFSKLENEIKVRIYNSYYDNDDLILAEKFKK